jgi:peptide/nickel transport system ATP-binding protein
VTYILISHDLAVVYQLASEILVMKDGWIVESGPTADVLRSPAHPYTRLLCGSVPRKGWKLRRALQGVENG